MSDDLKTRHREGPDPRVDGDLMDETWTPTPDDFFTETPEQPPSPRRKRSSLHIFLAVMIIAGLLFIGLGTTIRLFTLPSLTFIQQSRELHQLPLVQRTRQAVVQIHADELGGHMRQGTGFNIDPSGIVVTNRHVIEDARFVAVTFRERGTFYAADWIIHPEADLAVILFDAIGLPTVPLRDTSIPATGEEVYIIGNPLGLSYTAIQGTLRGHVRLTGMGTSSVLTLLIDAPIYPGASGSPVFDKNGHVIGVVYAQVHSSRDESPRGLAVSVSEVHWLLNQTVQ